MHDRFVPVLLQRLQHSPHLALGDADLLGRLFLSNQSLLGLFQAHQPVSFGLGHQQLSFVQLPDWTPSIGHFYFAQLGHYYFAATHHANCERKRAGSGTIATELSTDRASKTFLW